MIIKRITWIVCALIFIAIVFLPNRVSNKIKNVFLSAFKYPLSASEVSSRNLAGLLEYKHILQSNSALRREVGLLKGRLTSFEEIRLENLRLQKLFEFKEKVLFDTVASRVIGRDTTNWFNTIIIDKGTNDGIREGAAVLSCSGLAGRVIEADGGVCRVMLLTDPVSRVAAKIQRTRDEALLEGVYKGLCRMKYLPLESKIMQGDKVVTSANSGLYPEGLLIGEVISISHDASSLYTIALVRPEAALMKLEEVLCVKEVKSSF
ncbi:MAG: rod shape-determining protein MreC [Candidatus Omnitrophica bacterium]|nr:rod shape-determining protein MreC [Candidatus Omnitrophota bacterium]